jgi:hypothetical protein
MTFGCSLSCAFGLAVPRIILFFFFEQSAIKQDG